jgi:hypothetical protein
MFAYFPAILLLLLQVSPGADWNAAGSLNQNAAWVHLIRQASEGTDAAHVQIAPTASKKQSPRPLVALAKTLPFLMPAPVQTWPETPYVCAQRPRDGPVA